ncbi:MAG: DUF58 domain-containing protein [Candidatus Woesearchaeota archaeon]
MAIRKLDADLLPKIRKADIYAKQNVLSSIIEGNWTTTFKGHGIEFAGYRAYSYGDDASLIDWKASLRAKTSLVKEYEEEKSVNVYFLLDVSNSMLFTSQKKLKAEIGAEIVSSVSYAVLHAGDGVGLSMITDKLVTRLPINMGRKMHYFIMNDLSNVNNYGGGFDLDAVFKYLFSSLKDRAVIIIISDFIGLNNEWYKYLRIAAQKYQIIGIMLRDPRDRELPKDSGQYILEDPFTKDNLYIDTTRFSAAYKAYVEKEEAEIEKHFKATKSDFIKLSTDGEIYTPLIKFFKRRAITQMVR